MPYVYLLKQCKLQMGVYVSCSWPFNDEADAKSSNIHVHYNKCSTVISILPTTVRQLPNCFSTRCHGYTLGMQDPYRIPEKQNTHCLYEAHCRHINQTSYSLHLCTVWSSIGTNNSPMANVHMVQVARQWASSIYTSRMALDTGVAFVFLRDQPEAPPTGLESLGRIFNFHVPGGLRAARDCSNNLFRAAGSWQHKVHTNAAILS